LHSRSFFTAAVVPASVSASEQQVEIVEATDETITLSNGTIERHPCPGQYVISWSPAICVPWPNDPVYVTVSDWLINHGTHLYLSHLKVNFIVWTGKLKNKHTSKPTLTCQRCLHEWVYKGKNPFFTLCPHCRTTVRTTRKKNLHLEINEQTTDTAFEVNKNTLRN